MTMQLVGTTPSVEPLADINKRLQKTFKVFGKISEGIIDGHIKAAIVSGAPGCGKTYLLERDLRAAEERGNIVHQSMKGVCSAIGLYQKLFACSEEGAVLLIDDCDSIFGDMDALNLLKCALDTGKTRMVHWNKESRVLAEEGIPRRFEFNGAVIFITNIDFSREIERNNKITPHYQALLSRTIYVDLGIHSRREVMVRVMQVVYSSEFLTNTGITMDDAKEIIDWLNLHLNALRVLSVRQVLQLVSLMKTDPDWKDMAEGLMLRKR